MIVLEAKGIQATFDPEHGLNMMSLVIEGHELIAQSTKNGFFESSRGLGPLIGPTFTIVFLIQSLIWIAKQ